MEKEVKIEEKTFNVLERPYTIEEILKKKDDNNYLDGIIEMDFSIFVEDDFDTILDTMSEELTGSPLLMDIEYEIVGVGPYNVLFIKVYGDVSSILESEFE